LRFHSINPFAAAAIMVVLAMGIIGLFVVLPIACIQMAWNLLASPFCQIPSINVWQSCLLYLALTLTLYLLGFVQLDIEAKGID